MEGLINYLLLLLSQFAGGPGPIENNLMRFGLPAVMWAVLLVVAWSRQRESERPREKWLVWGFGLALARELFMFLFISLQISGIVERHAAYFISAPLEQAVTMASLVVIASAFLRYILDDAPIASRYLKIGLIVTLLCYLVTFLWWADYSRANPQARFGQSWASGVFHLASAVLLVGAMYILSSRKGWVRNVMMVALSMWLVADIIRLISLARNDISLHVISHSLYVLAIPLLGYIYIREQALERGQAINALRDSELRLREIIDHTQAGYFFIDRWGHIQQVNNAWLQMHGYDSRSEIVGMHYSLTQPQEVAAEMRAMIVRLLHGEALPPIESMRLTKEGTIKYHTASINPVVQGEEVVGLEGFLIDRTEQVKAESEVQRRKEQMAVLHAIAATIGESRDLQHMLTSILERVVSVTKMKAGWIYLYDQRGALQLVAAHGAFFTGDENPQQPTAAMDDCIHQIALGGMPQQRLIALEPTRPDLQPPCPNAAYLFAGVPVKSQENVQGVLALLGCGVQEMEREVRLLTAIAPQIGLAVEKAQLAEDAAQLKLLQELDRLRSELIANVSHDLRTPLGLIKLSSTSLMAGDVDFGSEMRQEMLSVIVDETTRLEKLVDDLLLLSQVESGRLQLNKRETLVLELVERAVSGMEATGSAPLHIAYEVDPPSLAAELDQDRMEQVLRNLLSNAIKYSPQGGTIRVEGYHVNGELFLTVADQGIGIPAEELPRVFDRFYRLDNPVTRHVRGAGLGLSVCRNLVRAHGGQIWAESILGRGSTFIVAMPLAVVRDGETVVEKGAAV